MVDINFDKVRAQLDHTLAYRLDGDEIFSIKPKIGEKARFIKVMSGLKDNKDSSAFVGWLVGLIKETSELKPEQEEQLEFLIKDFEGDFITQTMIGFKIQTQEQVDLQKQKLEEKYLEKNLN